MTLKLTVKSRHMMISFKDTPAISFRLIQEADENDAVDSPTPQPTPQPQPGEFQHLHHSHSCCCLSAIPCQCEDGYRFMVGNDAVWNGEVCCLKSRI